MTNYEISMQRLRISVLLVFGTFEKTKWPGTVVLVKMLNFILNYCYSHYCLIIIYVSISVNCLFQATAPFLLKSIFKME